MIYSKHNANHIDVHKSNDSRRLRTADQADSYKVTFYFSQNNETD